MKTPALPVLACLDEPDALLREALVSALGSLVQWGDMAEPSLRLLILGGADAYARAAAYQGSANIIVLATQSPPVDFPHAALQKPFRIGGFVDLARRLAQRAPVIVLGDGKLYPQARQWEKGGVRQPLTEKEVDILVHLAAAGEAVGREALLEEVWGYNQGVSTHTLETHIYRLRQKIENDPETPTILKTGPLAGEVNGSGYYVVNDE